ncbi:hypothetical protein HYU09_04365 [Candidatus Woesearchaeota archaeon]|nr:hypothetical protein [Candidatus Woesearchaeota archaeon]
MNYQPNYSGSKALLPPGVATPPPISYGGTADRVVPEERAILLTKNPAVYGAPRGTLTPILRTGGKTPMHLHGNNGEVPVYVTDTTTHVRPSDLTLVDLASFPLDTPELEALVDGIRAKSSPVIGVGRAVVYFPGHNQALFNGYSRMAFGPLLRKIENNQKPTIN